MRHALALVVLLTFQAPARAPFSAKVVGISDGDPLTVLQGVDAVEPDLDLFPAPEHGQSCGSKAKQRASRWSGTAAIGTARCHLEVRRA